MKNRFVLVFLLLSYALLIIPFTSHLRNRPMDVKLGYLPDVEILKLASGEFRNLLADLLIMKVLFYYGTLVDPDKPKSTLQQRPDYPTMYRTIETAVRLDPYNMDAYYFSQAAFTWEIGHAADVNKLLAYGMKYRTWDYTLPFYAGFNEAYFLKNFSAAATYMKRAAEISGDQLFVGLAGRFFYESGQTGLAISFVDSMIKGARDKNIKKTYEVRKKALIAVDRINRAFDVFVREKGYRPQVLTQLVEEGYLREIPKDPYGGRFYLDREGKVRSTSKFAFAQVPADSMDTH